MGNTVPPRSAQEQRTLSETVYRTALEKKTAAKKLKDAKKLERYKRKIVPKIQSEIDIESKRGHKFLAYRLFADNLEEHVTELYTQLGYQVLTGMCKFPNQCTYKMLIISWSEEKFDKEMLKAVPNKRPKRCIYYNGETGMWLLNN